MAKNCIFCFLSKKNSKNEGDFFVVCFIFYAFWAPTVAFDTFETLLHFFADQCFLPKCQLQLFRDVTIFDKPNSLSFMTSTSINKFEIQSKNNFKTFEIQLIEVVIK